eukprot:1753432-Amphidinium_carterae.1
MSSEVSPCTRHMPSCDASPAGAKLASAHNLILLFSFSLSGLNLRPSNVLERVVGHRRFLGYY